LLKQDALCISNTDIYIDYPDFKKIGVDEIVISLRFSRKLLGNWTILS